ncbi:MAG: penicillin acylase family protein [Flavobacteriaceae bacterium]|nr:penicillin acylase family protein [Flavobacteriaceae bacterium]
MQIFKKTIIIFLSIILLLLVWLFFYTQHLKPTYKGNLKLKNINNNVEVFYDDIGVPHIYAENQNDAYIALGYVHAQDRLWQMELIRRVASGRLSEIFGKDKEKGDNAILKSDKFFLGLGIEDAAIKTIKKLDTAAQSYKLAMAYLDGINQFIDDGPTPIEYKIIGFKKEKFELKDMYNVFGYMSFSFATAHKTDPLLSKIKEKLEPRYLEELGIKIDPTTTLIKNHYSKQGVESNIVAAVNKIMNNLPISPFIGSNSWVVGPEKTASGKVIFANDPHIAFAQPAVWYQSHIVCPNFEIYGFNLALTPFPLLGHNRDYAYGLTMFKNDDIDFYREKSNPENVNQYFRNGEYVPFEIKEKTIKIKNSPSESFLIKIGKHGPIMNDFIDLIDEKEPIAMDWIYTKFKNEMLDASYGISHANSIDEFRDAVSLIHAPGLNVMYGDANDNIAWFAAGMLYKHDNNVNTQFILNGANNEDEKLTYLNFSQNPQAINPPWNYVYSANNQPDKLDTGFYPGYYSPKDRAERIVEKLDKLTAIKVDDMKKLINDVTSSVIPKLIPEILKNIATSDLSENESVAIKILRNWDGSFELNQVAPTIFTKFKYQFYKNTFEDELGEVGFKQFLNTPISKKQFSKQILNKNSIWSDDIQTSDIIETKQYNIVKSFKETIQFLEKQHGQLISKWKWKNVHTVEYKHPIGKKLSLLGLNFNIGPFPVSGSNGVLNNQMFTMNGKGIYNVHAGPSTRRIVDFNDVENSIAIIPTGQSGNIFSKHYQNQAQRYLKGEFFTMLLNTETIQQFDDRLIFSPK